MLTSLYPLVRPLLFSLDAEKAHEWTLQALSTAPTLSGSLMKIGQAKDHAPNAHTLFGLPIASPVGLAAGLDKNGVAIPFWPSLGFGFIEVGTVTAIPQLGNPKPRLFRLKTEEALINRMGFNNHGSEALAKHMRSLRNKGQWPTVPVGANVGKSKVTPLDKAPDDYALSVRRLQGLADYFTVNVSSPNTPGLRSLQEPDALKAILDVCLEEAKGTPVAVKLAPDLEPEMVVQIVDIICDAGISGIIATNTTVRRDLLQVDPNEGGGLSGRPIWPHSKQIVTQVVDQAAGRVPVIGCGGVDSPERAQELLNAGCAAVQLYTALIYKGPKLPSEISNGLRSKAN